jgi:ABC-type nickel/cobalt efflux system permease component RcnA
MRRLCCAGVFIALISIAAVQAHPVPRSEHDRTIVVRLQPGEKPNHVAIRVEYRLEVDEDTVLLEDMWVFRDEVDIAKYAKNPLGYFAEFTRIYAPILADNLLGKLNGEAVAFTCVERGQRLVDEKGQKLGHLRCDLVFRAEVALEPGQANTFWFREANFLLGRGLILVSYVNQTGLKVIEQHVPSEALQKRPPTQHEPGDDERLRKLQLALIATEMPRAVPKQETAPSAPAPEAAPEPPAESDETSLLALIAIDRGFWFKMLLAAVFGGAHALTPGHGKTLVAAYLIGQRGTMWHALVLGMITTLTHTGAVLILAGILFFLPPHMKASFAGSLQQGLGLVAGLMVVGLGFWLLLQRLAGRADHFHVGGGHSHSHRHAPPATDPSATEVRWWGLVVLGITGGLVPCWDAIIVFLYFIGRGEFWIVLPALLAFSAGLAAVLVLIGVLVVQVPKFTQSRLGDGRVIHALPVASALVIIAIGVWLCYKTV